MITDIQSTNEIILTKCNREEFDKYAKTTLRSILSTCNLQEWRVECYYPEGNRQGQINCDVDHSYLTISIYFNDKIIADWIKKDFFWVDHVLCHEVAHIYTEELYRIAINNVIYAQAGTIEQVREQNTERVCRLIEKGLSHNGTVDSTSETDKNISRSDSKG